MKNFKKLKNIQKNRIDIEKVRKHKIKEKYRREKKITTVFYNNDYLKIL